MTASKERKSASAGGGPIKGYPQSPDAKSTSIIKSPLVKLAKRLRLPLPAPTEQT